MPDSSDDEGRRDERRERRRQRVHDRLANLIEENRMLTLLTQEDSEEIQKLRGDAEASEIEKRRLVAVNEQQDTVIRQLQDQILHLEHCKFVADVQARTIEQQDKSIKELLEESKLQSAQSQMDAETIRAMHAQLNEVTLERDRLATRVGKSVQSREEAEAEVKMLLVHADELRHSNVALAARLTELEEKVLAFEEEDYADFFTRVSRRDIANGRVQGSDAQLLMIKRKGTPPSEKRLGDLAAKAGITVEAMIDAEKHMPVALRVGDVSPQHRGVMELSPEQLRILGHSNPSVSPKRFSAYALQSQFGISPESKSTTGSSRAQPSSSIERRDSKEVADLTQRTTDLPLPKSTKRAPSERSLSNPTASSVSGDVADEEENSEVKHRRSGQVPAVMSLSPTGSPAPAPTDESAGKGRRRVLQIVSPREEELLKQQQQEQQDRLSKGRHQPGANLSPAYTYLVVPPDRLHQGHQAAAASAHVAPHKAETEERRQADNDERRVPPVAPLEPLSLCAAPVPKPSKQPPQDTSMRAPPHNVDASDITRALPHVAGPAAQRSTMGTTGSASGSTSSTASAHAHPHHHHRRPLASLPVRDALSGSIVVGGEGGSNANDDDNDGVLSSRRLLSPSNEDVGADSDSSDEDDGTLDSPSRLSIERGTLLKERLEVQRRTQSDRSSGGEIVSSQPYPGDDKVQLVVSGLHNNGKDGPSGATFRTMKEMRLQRGDANPNGVTSTASANSNAVSGDRMQQQKSFDEHKGGGNTSLHQKHARNNNVSLQPSKFLPPIASVVQPQSPGYLSNRPSTCPLVVEAVYGERGGATDEDKMYLVKFVSVESEQWTSAANIDQDCEPLKEWKRSKARMRQQAQKKMAGKSTS